MINSRSTATVLVQIAAEIAHMVGTIAAGFGAVWFVAAAVIDWNAIDPKAGQVVATVTTIAAVFGLLLFGGRLVAKRPR